MYVLCNHRTIQILKLFCFLNGLFCFNWNASFSVMSSIIFLLYHFLCFLGNNMPSSEFLNFTGILGKTLAHSTCPEIHSTHICVLPSLAAFKILEMCSAHRLHLTYLKCLSCTYCWEGSRIKWLSTKGLHQQVKIWAAVLNLWRIPHSFYISVSTSSKWG